MLREIRNQKDNLHHAYLIEGDYDEVLPHLLRLLEENLNFSTKNNPDFWTGVYETFGIDEGRKINDLQSKKSFAGGRKIFLLKTNFITREAQNSLLKMFEEPTEDTHFFIIMDSTEVLLPTLKSRLSLVRPYQSEHRDEDVEKFTKDFIKETLANRLEMVKKFFGDTKKKIPADKGGAIKFLNELEKQLRENKNLKELEERDQIIFEEIINARSYLNDRSPSVKMLLEHICVIV